MTRILFSLLLAWTCYAPTPLFLLQNQPPAASSGLTLPTITSGTYQLVLVADDLTAGSTVSGWTSRVGSWSAAQGTVAKRPSVVAADVGTRNGVVFDAIDDFLMITSFNPGGTAGITVFLVFKATSTANFGIMVEANANFDNAGTFNFYKNNSGNTGAFSAAGGAGTYTQWQTSGSIAGTHIFHGTIDRALSSNEATGWLDNVSSGSRPLNNNLSGTFTTHDLYIGARAGTSLFYSGSLAAVIVCSGVLDSTDRDAIYTALDNWY